VQHWRKCGLKRGCAGWRTDDASRTFHYRVFRGYWRRHALAYHFELYFHAPG
jgi:hypothetical protein